jgi:hypothetical protein
MFIVWNGSDRRAGRVSANAAASLAKPQTVARMKGPGAIFAGDTSAEHAKLLRTDHERWARVIKAAGMKAE